MKPREVERLVLQAGWLEIENLGRGSHRVYRHPTQAGIIVIPWHSGRDIPRGTLNQILKAAGIKDRPQ